MNTFIYIQTNVMKILDVSNLPTNQLSFACRLYVQIGRIPNPNPDLGLEAGNSRHSSSTIA